MAFAKPFFDLQVRFARRVAALSGRPLAEALLDFTNLYMPLWGQFLDRHGEVKEERARPFRERLARCASVDRLHECFPLQALAVEAPARVFHERFDGSGSKKEAAR